MIFLDHVVRDIRTKAVDTHVVAIDGPSGSGKSTLAARLARHVPGAVVIATDDFSSWSDPTGTTWWDRFNDDVVVPAFAGRRLHYQVRDWDNDEYGTALAGWRDIPASPLVILEGATSARSTVRERGAYSIWIEAPAERRLERGLERDGEDHRDVWLHWMQAEAAFFAADRTKGHVNLRVDGDPVTPHDPTTQLMTI